jgi:energy-coupling factor transporter ATP-binding protein EcfA2
MALDAAGGSAIDGAGPMTLTDIWQTLPPEAQSFLLDLAGKLVEALFKEAASTLRAAVRGAEAKQALWESLTRAVAAFLACLELPEGLQERWDWEAHIQTLLGPIFADPDVQEALLRAVLYEGCPEAVDIAPFRAAWEACYGKGGEATLPWREGQSLETAVRAFARAFEEEVRSRPALHTFLLTALLRQVADRLQRGVTVEGMDALIGAVERLTQQQERLIALFIDLARQGYSVSVQGDVTGTLIITGDNNKVIISDGGRLTALFRRLPEPTRALAEYRAHIRRTCALLPLGGLALPEIHGRPLDPTRLRIPLDRVYIRLRALSYRDRPEGPEDARTLARYLRDRHLEYRQWEERRPTAESQAIPPEEAVARHHQLVILGPPGAGKSTFLRHLAWAWAETDTLPLLVPLGRADVAMAEGRSLLEAALDYLTEHKAGAERKALRAALEAEIREKRVCWLWDGLDEVRVHRREVVEALGRLAADGHRMVITSRPVGYVSIPGCDALYEVLPLLPEDARAFTGLWFRALAEAQGVPKRERERWARERAGWLRRQLEERPGLREVARNPLMLTFLAVLAGDEPRRDLPRRRKDLYALYIERLFTAWEERRRPGEEKSLLPGVEDPHAAREVLLWGFRRVALHLHRAYGEQPERAAFTEVKGVLAKELGQNAKLDRFQAAARAEAILRFWEEAGLLDVYRLEGREFLAFRHLTFQEYGAARALAEAYPEDPDGLWAELRPHLLDDEWAEVIPLVLAYLDDATPLLDRLLEANAQDKGLQRPLFRAAAALAEGAKAAEETARRVVDRLERIAKTRQEVWRFVGQADAHDAVKALGRLEGVPYAVKRLLALAHQETVDPWVRVQAAEALGNLGRARELLTLAQQETVDPWVRVEAAEALGRLGRTEEAAPILRTLAPARNGGPLGASGGCRSPGPPGPDRRSRPHPPNPGPAKNGVPLGASGGCQSPGPPGPDRRSRPHPPNPGPAKNGGPLGASGGCQSPGPPGPDRRSRPHPPDPWPSKKRCTPWCEWRLPKPWAAWAGPKKPPPSSRPWPSKKRCTPRCDCWPPKPWATWAGPKKPPPSS